MPVFEITSPDGKVFEVTAPDGASQDQVLEYAKNQFAQMGKPSQPTPPSAPQTTPQVPQESFTERVVKGAKEGFTTGGGFYGGIMGGVAAADPLKRFEEFTDTAGNKVTDWATKAGLPPEVAGGVGTAAYVGLQAIPSLAGGFGAGKAVAPVLQDKARTLMQSAIKPTLHDLKTGRAATAIQTMLDEGLNVTKSGVATLRERIGELNNEIVKAIAGSNATVDKGKVAGTLHDLTKRFEKQVTPGSDVRAIENAWSEFMGHPLLAGKQDMPVQLAQELKQGTYAALGKKSYGELKGADTEAQKALARGLKEEIATAVPAVSKLNAQESKLLTTLDVTERRVLMEANKNPMGLAWLASHPAAWAAFMADRSGPFKSLAARIVNKNAEAVPQLFVGGGIAAGQGISGELNRESQ
jgi:hypothetical protein